MYKNSDGEMRKILRPKPLELAENKAAMKAAKTLPEAR